MGDGMLLDTMGPKNVSRAKILLKLPAHFSLKKFVLSCWSDMLQPIHE
jgi:hypothetical protein